MPISKRKIENIEFIIGISGAQVIADVFGTKVEILAISLGKSEHADILPLVLPFMRKRIEESLRDYVTVGRVFDWDEEVP